VAEQKTGKYCKNCQKRVMAIRPGTNHLLHLVLAVLTVGLWIPIWVLVSAKIGGWRCQQCGCKTGWL
jgi:hypothetical protein